ncbi:hypothetical protein F5Y18DRAFT_445064 [Xylariaceae sp. FL1019]|nr:hypothetical protein F5Y18DRAFT_445064 [Xylariaceae sp. FL1019]
MAGKHSDEDDSDGGTLECPWGTVPSVCEPSKPLKRMHWHVFKHHEEHYEDFANDHPFDKVAEPETPSLRGKFRCIHCGYRGGLSWRMGLHHLLYHNIAAAQSWKTNGHANEPIPPKATPRVAPAPAANRANAKAHSHSKETIKERVMRHGKERGYGNPPWLTDPIKHITRLVVDEIFEQAANGLTASEVNAYTDEFCRVFRDNKSFEHVTLRQHKEGGEQVLQEIEYTTAVYTAFKERGFNEDSEEPNDRVQGSKSWSMSDVFVLGTVFANGLSPEDAGRYFKHIPRDERPKIGRLMPSLGDAAKTKLSSEVVENLIHRNQGSAGENKAKVTPTRTSARLQSKGKGVIKSSDSGEEHEQLETPTFKSLSTIPTGPRSAPKLGPSGNQPTSSSSTHQSQAVTDKVTIATLLEKIKEYVKSKESKPPGSPLTPTPSRLEGTASVSTPNVKTIKAKAKEQEEEPEDGQDNTKTFRSIFGDVSLRRKIKNVVNQMDDTRARADVAGRARDREWWESTWSFERNSLLS